MATSPLLAGVLAATTLLAEPARAAGRDSGAAPASAPQGAAGAQAPGARPKPKVSPYAKANRQRAQERALSSGSRGKHHTVKKAPPSGGALKK